MQKYLPLLLALLLAPVLPLQAQTPPSGADPWAGLRFLLGNWEAKTTGGMAQAVSTGSYSFALELNGQLLARHSQNSSCSGPASYNCQHSDLLYIYAEAGSPALRAIYFDSEGHTIHYAVSTPQPNTAVFLSDPAQPGPRFRLSYERAGDLLQGKFELQAPGQGAFHTYLSWTGNQK